MGGYTVHGSHKRTIHNKTLVLATRSASIQTFEILNLPKIIVDRFNGEWRVAGRLNVGFPDDVNRKQGVVCFLYSTTRKGSLASN